MKRILVVEDEQHIVHFLKRGLAYKGFDVTVTTNGHDAIESVRTSAPDAMVLDIMLPDLDGIDVCRYLRSLGYSTLPILLLTAKDDLTNKIVGLESGADDYITKPFDFEELVARIRAALRRVENTQRHTKKIQVADLVIDAAAHQVWRGDILIELTRREYDLLELLAQNAGHVLSKERIFERVWGYDNEAGLEVIKVYINYIRAKLNVGGKTDLIHAVRGIGYVLKP